MLQRGASPESIGSMKAFSHFGLVTKESGGYLKLLKYGGSWRAQSTFERADSTEFSATLKHVIEALKAGKPPEDIGVLKAYSFEEEVAAASKGNLEVVEYSGDQTSGGCVLRVKATGEEVPYKRAANILYKLRSDPKYCLKVGKSQDEQRESSRIRALSSGRITLISYGGSVTDQSSVFANSVNGTEFKSSVMVVKRALKNGADLALLGTVTRGPLELLGGLTRAEWAQKRGFGKDKVRTLIRDSPHLIPTAQIHDTMTDIELTVAEILDRAGIPFVHNKYLEGTSCRPDFVLPDHKIVIECDGLWWHCDYDPLKGPEYHVARRGKFLAQGYIPLFFYGDEIRRSPDVVESMILHRCGLLKDRIGARECTLLEGHKSVLSQYHLMGQGSGRCFSLEYSNEPIALLQVRASKKDTLDISRFCTKPRVVVPGAFTRLLKHALSVYGEKKVTSFVDMRYGTGEYLTKDGWQLKNKPTPSFYWTQGKERLHRMTYPGKTGYNMGYYRLWDCGQARYEKTP